MFEKGALRRLSNIYNGSKFELLVDMT